MTLPPRQQDLWQRPVHEPKFAAFKEWVTHWEAAGPDERSALVSEGVGLAKARRRALADLIQGSPRRALELAVPPAITKALPLAVRELIEERVNARGDYFVAGAMPLPGQEDEIPAMTRWAEINGEKLQVFTFDEGLGFVTKRAVPLDGIALPAWAGTNPPDASIMKPDKIMALSTSPVRQMDADEVGEAIAATDTLPLCPTSGQEVTVNDEPVGTELAGETFLYCGEWHAAAAASAAMDSLDLSRPDGAAPAGLPPVAESGFTEGYKRMLILRVDFPDHVDTGGNVTIGLTAAQTLLQDLRNYVRLMSYGKQTLAPLGPGGSAVTPVLRLPNNVAAYDNEGLGDLLGHARTAAASAGFDPANYDWEGVFTGSRPAAGYAGLAWVGGVGFHMANGYYGKHVVTHEFGHNLGLPHAHRWNTSDRTIVGAGELVEYGNRYDPIGATYDSIPGEKHFVGSYKNYIDWIPDADAPLINSTGLFRITTTDDIHSEGRRLLRVPKDNRNYWIEFRQNLNDALTSNGVFLQWANPDGRENSLLDSLPGSSGVSIAIGRTFSDPNANNGNGVHITPVAKGGTFPESMDVFVGIGSPVGNRSPRARVSGNTEAAPASTPVEFTVAATDPDNDTLAYYWDFGDGTSSMDNKPSQTHSFANGGEYAIQCVVSDMKGGTARDTFVLKVGVTPAFRVSGRVLDPNQRPLGGVKVTATSGSNSRFVFSDSDGTYTIPGLSDSNWTMAARETVSDAFNFSNPFFTNPVDIGPAHFANADFIGSTGPQETVTPLIAKQSLWKYFSTGAAPVGAWQALAYNDAAWEEGNGVLGYGNENGQATTIPFGPSSSNKWTSYYFRRKFSVADLSTFTALRLDVLRDDGVVVYLNGAEIFRDNMPAGTPNFSTRASDQVEPAAYLNKDISLTGLVVGENIIAAEVHQVAAGSSDVAYDLAFSGVVPLEGAGNSLVALTSPADGQSFEGPLPWVTMTANARFKNAAVSRVQFLADNIVVAEDVTFPYTFNWPNPAQGPHSLKAIATPDNGPEVASAEVQILVVAPAAVLIAQNAIWSYYSNGTGAPGGWQNLSFDDAGWASGPAQLGYDDGDEATTIPGGPATNRYLTSYFRRSFNIDDPKSAQRLFARLVRDDGAVVYLNGTEVIRSNMGPGAVTYSTLASGAASTEIENAVYSYDVNPAYLVPGRNVIAVEVHQAAANSSDLSFSFELKGDVTAQRARSLTLTGPGAITLPAGGEWSADPVAGGGLGITKVEFFWDGVKIGEDSSAPFAINWIATSTGNHVLTARATDTGGGLISSNEVAISVSAPYQTTALVSFGETWKFLDDGSGLPSNWTFTPFVDSAWSSGRAKLGYGGDGEATVVSYGAESNSKFITTYFRKKFTAAAPSSFSSLMLRLVRDDGAIVYLNGTELYRNNMPSGAATSTTLAAQAVDGPAEIQSVQVTLPRNLLVSGENQLAVEVHQASAGSSDAGFDLELLGAAVGTQPFYLTNPASNQQISAEVDFPLSVRVDALLGVQKVEYFAGPAAIGVSFSSPFTVLWTTPLLGTYQITARATLADGGSLSSAPVTVAIGQDYISATLIPAGSTWKYWDAGTLPAANWNAAAYNDASWSSGAARLGFGGDGEATALQYGGVGADGRFHSRLAYYFRKTFTLASGSSFEQVSLRYQRDDGIIIYVNGTEVLRNNMPAGPVTAATAASASATDETAWLSATVNRSLLVTGANIVAAEVHQQSDTSSDLGFDLELAGYGTNAAAVANSAPTAPPAIGLETAGGPSASMQVNLQDGTNGRLYLIECSNDLATWVPFSYELVRGGVVDVPVLRFAPSQFYRARWLPALP
ncbi:MAG: Ig-like domain-containing protein [Verrucomicrobiales bacterium]